MADIFISYASVDRPVARRLAAALEGCGWSVWWDHRSLRGGQHFDRVIEEAILGARVVVVVWSKASIESKWVRDEATLALEEDKLVPLRIDTTRLPMRFRNIHTIDFSAWTRETNAEPFERLVRDLSHYLGPPIPPINPEPSPEPVLIDPDPSPWSTGDSFFKGVITKLRASIAGVISLADFKQAANSLRNEMVQRAVHLTNAVMRSSYSIVPGLFLKTAKPTVLVALIVSLMVVLTILVILEPRVSRGPSLLRAAYDRGEYATALNLARPAAEGGDQEAQYILGLLYENGQGVSKSYAEAMKWFRKAADQGTAAAQFDIGDLYYYGWGVPQDYAEAMSWFRKAADQGHGHAMYSIGLIYAHGLGVPRDMAQAQTWMQKAAAAGSEEAKEWLRGRIIIR